MMNDRELLEFIATQVGNLTIKVESLEEGQKSLEEGQKSLEKGQQRIELKIENDIDPKLNALLDGYKQLAESQTEMKSDISKIKSDINDIKFRQESQEFEIKVIKGGNKSDGQVKKSIKKIAD
jgi:chromosome segregation ATPase